MRNKLTNGVSEFITVKFAFVIEAGFIARVLAEVYSSKHLLLLEGVNEEVLKLDKIVPDKYEYFVEGKERKEQIVYLYQLISVAEDAPDALCIEERFFINESTKRVSVKIRDKDSDPASSNAVITVELLGAD